MKHLAQGWIYNECSRVVVIAAIAAAGREAGVRLEIWKLQRGAYGHSVGKKG